MEVLRRNGVSRFLNPELEGGQAVATGPLWRALAAPLALTGLTVQGIPHDQALVALHAGKVDRSIIPCCTALASEVRALSLDMPDREGLAWALQRRFGIPVLEQGGDVALCFSGRKQGIDLRGDTPQPGGIFVGLFRSDASGGLSARAPIGLFCGAGSPPFAGHSGGCRTPPPGRRGGGTDALILHFSCFEEMCERI